jgi:homoserine dehydrogenase
VNGSGVRVGLLGCGTVGSALVQLVQEQAEGIESRTGLRLEISRVAVRNASKDRGVDLPRDLFTNDAA